MVVGAASTRASAPLTSVRTRATILRAASRSVSAKSELVRAGLKNLGAAPTWARATTLGDDVVSGGAGSASMVVGAASTRASATTTVVRTRSTVPGALPELALALLELVRVAS